jgi:hypothetical protein
MSQTSTFGIALGATCYLDQVHPTVNTRGWFDVGRLTTGGTKAQLLRAIHKFDVFNATLTGRSLIPSDVIVSAKLDLNINYSFGTLPPSGGCEVRQSPRTDFDYASATWDNYKTGNAWTGGGASNNPADVIDATKVTHTGPSGSIGTYTITGLGTLVANALTTYGGLVILVHKNTDETMDAQWGAGGSSPGFGVLTVVYNPLVADAPSMPILRRTQRIVRGDFRRFRAS